MEMCYWLEQLKEHIAKSILNWSQNTKIWWLSESRVSDWALAIKVQRYMANSISSYQVYMSINIDKAENQIIART